MNMDIRNRIFTVSVYSATHFLVDFACAFLMFRAISGTQNWYAYMLLYNFCAFAMQMPLGIIADKLSKNYLLAAVGCVLVAAAYAICGFPMAAYTFCGFQLAAVLAAGIGNAMFHIGGGIDVLNVSDGKAGALGIFVSPGAFGIYFGTIFGKIGIVPAIPNIFALFGNGGTAAAVPNVSAFFDNTGPSSAVTIVLALVAAAALILFMRKASGAAYPKNAPLSLAGGSSRRILIAAACFFAVVCLRSFVGLTFNFPWKGIGNWGVALLCAVAFGKAAGGFVADKFGATKTACFTLGTASVLFLFSHLPAAGAAAMFLFNMTMPVTLWLTACKAFPGAKGFSFGLLTFALFLGYLPAYFGLRPPTGAAWPFALAGAISLALLWIGLKGLKNERSVG